MGTPLFGRVFFSYRTQRYQDAHALYAFKSRGFGGEIGVAVQTKLSIRRLRRFRIALEIIAEFCPIDVVVKKHVGRRGTINRIHKAGKSHMNFTFPTTGLKKQRTPTTIAMASRCRLR